MENRFLNYCAGLGIVVLSVYLLIIGQSFLQPLVLAIVLWYLMINLQQSIAGLKRFGLPLPGALTMLIAIGLVIGVIWLLVVLVNASVNQLIESAPRYQTRLQDLVREGYALFGVAETTSIQKLLAGVNIPAIVRSLVGAFTSIASEVGIIMIYTAFLLLEYRTFDQKLAAMSRSEGQETRVRSTFSEISYDIKIYVRIKTVLSVLTAAFSYLVMKLVGLDLAEFWAIVIFVMNYIPTIGWALGVLPPILLLAIQFTSAPLIVGASFVLIAIPTFINNVIEPRLMGRSLNLSSLVIILALAFWGSIWGVLGMFLCVPIMAILNIVLAKFEATRPLAILFSADGNIDGKRVPPPKAKK